MNIVFDFGAVLFRWQPAELVAQAFPGHAPTADSAQALAKALFSHADWHAFDQGLVSPDEVIQKSAERLQLPLAPLRGLVSSIGELLTPMDATVQVLAALRSLRDRQRDVCLYFLSNMPALYARELEQAHAFLQWFDGGIFSGDAGLAKPDPAIYALLESRYSLQPVRTLFIDDLAANVDVARSRGWQGIQFESAVQLKSGLVPHLGPF
jgi:putative hydrolase of the HAD superfamily